LSPKRVDLILSGISVKADPFEIQQEGQANLSWDPASLSWSGVTLVQKKTRVEMSGRLGLEGSFARAPLSGRLHAEHLPLRLLPVPPTAGIVGGHINADLSWSGTVGAPLLTGQGELKNGYYRYPESDLAVTPITAKFQAEGSKLVLTEASATTPEGGKASATGFMAFKGFLPADFSLIAKGTAFPFVVGRDVEGKADFDITLKGTLDKPRIEGAATVVKGRVQLPETARQEALPASIRFTNAPPGSPLASQDDAEAPVVGNLRGAVQLQSKGNLWVTSRSLLAELTGSLQVRFTEDGPAINGALNLGNGRYLFQGKKFEITASKILFKGTTDLNPYLDLNARYEAGGTEVFIHITGPADKPELALSSRPSMPEGDILSVLMFGRRQQELDSAQSQSWSLAALALAGQYQASPILASIQEKLGLETLEVGAASEGGTEVGFSKHLGDRVVVEYRQSFGTVPEQRVNVRYRVNRHVSLQADTSSLGRSGADVFWEQVY
jgi:translocation and assembly module TamB